MGAKHFLPRFYTFEGMHPDIGSNTLQIRAQNNRGGSSDDIARWGTVYATSVNLTGGLSLGQPTSADDSPQTTFYQITFNDDFYIAQTSATTLKIGTGVDSSANAALTIVGTSSISSTGDFLSLGSITAASHLQAPTYKPTSADFIFYEGSPDDHETTMTITDPTADRTITFPDASGTVAMTSDIPTVGVTSLSGTTVNGITTYASSGTLDVESNLIYSEASPLSILQMKSVQDTGDTFSITTTTHGTTNISTTDDDGTQADLIISADGEVDVKSAENKINKIYDFHSTTFETTYSDDQASGTIIKYSVNDTALNGSEIYYLRNNGIWHQAYAGAVAAAGNVLIGVGLGGDPQTVGVLLKGFVRVASTEILNKPTNVPGVPLYISTTAGHFDFTAPSASGDIVRIVGYAIDEDGGDVLVYFDPDKTFVEIA